MKELDGKNGIVTGANRGIGNAVVHRLAEAGCNIWACARVFHDEFEDEMQKLALECGVSIIPVYFDLTDETQMKAAFKKIYMQKKPIDILVNAAGVVNTSLFFQTPMNTMKEVFTTNFFAAVELTQLTMKIMLRNKKGSIVNISSIIGQDANPTNCAYGSSKAAINAFTKILASEVGEFGIRVNAVAPGLTRTDMIQSVQEKARDTLLDRCAMNRLAEPAEIAETVLFLASDRSSFINGQIIRVDGGAR